MSSRSAKKPRSTSPELETLSAALREEVPYAAALRALLHRPATERLRCDFTASVRGRWGAPTDPAPWVAAALGLADPRQCASRAYKEGERFVARLRCAKPRRRRGIVFKARQEAANPALLDLFVEEARKVQGTDPEAALGWLDLAYVTSAALGAVGFPRAPLQAALLRVEAFRANALRLAGELPAADRIFGNLATDPRREALADPRAHAELLSLEASLRIDLRQFEEADRVLASAERLCRAVGDSVGAAKALLKRGSAAFYAGDGERAAQFHRQAAELLDPVTEPTLAWAAQHNLADTLATLGRTGEAAAVLHDRDDLFQSQTEPSVQIRRLWVEARIARAEERFDAAEELLTEVRDGWLTLGRPYEAALATLDSAELHLARGDWREVQRMAELLAPVFETRGVHREAQAALILFQQAAQAERLTEQFLAALRRYLPLARNDRTFRFDPAAVSG